MNKIKIIYLLLLFLTATSANCQNYKIVNAAGAHKLIKDNHSNDNFYIIDSRPISHYEKGHIPGAIHIDPFNEASAKKLLEMDKEATYLIHCRTRNRVFRLLRIMTQIGFSDITVLTEGWVGWVNAGYDVAYPGD